MLLIPQVAACDPRLALAHFAGRPLLMLNGRHDYTVTPDMGARKTRFGSQTGPTASGVFETPFVGGGEASMHTI